MADAPKLTKMVGVRISEEGHRALRVMAAETMLTPGRLLDDLIRAFAAKGELYDLYWKLQQEEES